MTTPGEPKESAEHMLEAFTWPQRIKASVVEPGDDPRLHGYAVEGDLARNYGASDVLYLSLYGELPEEAVSRAFDVAVTFLSTLAVSEGPTHAAYLARVCNAPARAVVEVAAVALAERAHFVVDGLGGFLSWLDEPSGPPPAEHQTDDAAVARSLARLRAALPPAFPVPALQFPLTRPAALAAVLHACGLRKAEQLELVWTLAALGTTFAEGFAARPFAFREYPMDTPAFRYEEKP
jgi:hypothetical protein